MFCTTLLRSVFLLFVAALLTACVTARTGFDYATVMQKVGPPPPGHSRIVVMSEKGSGGYADLTIDGLAARSVKPGTYIYADRRAGNHQLLATQSMFPGDTKYEITTVPGRTYFLVARSSYRSRVVQGTAYGAGLAGALVATVITSGVENPGPVDLIPMDDATARLALAELQLAE